LPLFVDAAGVMDCASVNVKRHLVLPDGLPMYADHRNVNSSIKAWYLNATNWQGTGRYPYEGLAFLSRAKEYPINVLYEVQVNQVEEMQNHKGRKFFVKFQNDRKISNRIYYINSGDTCSKVENHDASTTAVTLYEYTV
jgi:hypothetical protein